MSLSFFVARTPSATNTQKPKFLIHISEHRDFAEENALAQKEDSHASMSENSAGFVINTFYFAAYFCFTGMVGRFLLLQIIVKGIGRDSCFLKHPTDAEFVLMFRDKSISL